MANDIERELLRAGQPDLPPELRRRVLETTSPLVQPHVSRLDAIWFSPRWRVAAALAFVGLVAVDRLSGVTGDVTTRVDGLPVGSSVAVAVQAAIDAGLGRADVAAIAAHAASLSLTSEVDATRAVRTELTGVYR
jgi:hypothetical protein